MLQDQGFFSKNILLEGKSAVVTGSSRGIGRAIAIELARQGCDVLVNYSRNQSAATEVKEAIIQQGRKSIIFQANVGNLSHHQPLIEAAIDAFGKVDLLINNAGITIISDVLAESEKDYDAVMDVNLKGPHFLTQRVANYMIEKKIKGCIIYTLSISDTLASDNRAAYCMSKAALEMGMKVYAGRLVEKGIKVNGVEVGVTNTDLARVRIPDYIEASEKGYITMFRPGEPEDVANAVMAGIKIYDTGVMIPCAGGVMTPLLNLRKMTALNSNQTE